MILRTETLVGASPEIVEAITAALSGEMPPYGDDAISQRMRERFSDLFGRKVEVFPTVTGTASNALALAVAVPSYSAVYCHSEAHIVDGEAGAFEFFSGGGRLVPIEGANGKFTAERLDAKLTEDRAKSSLPPPSAVSVTQLTEAGTLYSVAEVKAIGAVAHKHGLVYHMDGARFANALATVGCSAAEMTCDAGVDILSFGATKNGALMADCVVVFKPELVRTFKARQKRAGHTVAKMRFLSAQLEAYLKGDLWLRNARHANAMAQRLAEALKSVPGVGLQYAVQGNELFLLLSKSICDDLARRSIDLRRKATRADGTGMFRLVTSFATTKRQIDDLASEIRKSAS